MESLKTPLKVNYVVYTKVLKVEHRYRKTYLSGFGDTAEFVDIDKGWYVHFDGSYEALSFGMIEPQFKRGDNVRITFEKVDSCPPSQTTNPATSPSSS